MRPWYRRRALAPRSAAWPSPRRLSQGGSCGQNSMKRFSAVRSARRSVNESLRVPVHKQKKSPAAAGPCEVFQAYCAGAGADGGVVAGAGAALVGAAGAGAGADVERSAAGELFAAVRILSLLYVTT